MHALTSRRRLTVAAALALLLTGLAASVPRAGYAAPPPASAQLGAPSVAGLTPAAASAQAVRTGKPVELMSARTDWSQTFAQPGGGFSTVESVVPKRVHRPDGSWAPVDTTLTRLPGGSVAPVATTVGLVMSGGGTGPLYTLTDSGTSMSVSWPLGPLPAPTLSGATATYPDVLPGVNLLLSATSRGITELVEVTSAVAAANPELSSLTFPTSSTGLAISRDGVGDLAASTPSGQVVFSAPPPQMWDSSAMRAGDTMTVPAAAAAMTVPAAAAAPTVPAAAAVAAAVQARGPVPGDHAAKMAVATTAHSVSLRPDRRVLSGAGVTYPVFLDPEWDGQESNGVTWLDVWKDRAGDVSGDWEPESSDFGGIRSGVYCNYSTNGVCESGQGNTNWGIYRSYLNFPISKANGLSDADFIDAQLSINETWSWTCANKTTIDVYHTDKANRGIDWNSQPNQHVLSDSKSVAYGDTCPSHGVTFDAKPALSAVQSGSNLTLELRATGSDESNWNVNSWKRFSASSIDLIVYWRHAPDKPTNVGTRNAFDASTGDTVTDCATSSTNPDYIDSYGTTWQATIDDADGANGGNIAGEFDWNNLTNGNSNTLDAGQNNARPGTTFTGSRDNSDGDLYKWQAYGQTPSGTDADGNHLPTLTGSKAAACYYQIDVDAPTIAPTIASVPNSAGLTFTSGVPANPVGTQAVFQLSDPLNADPSDGVNDVVGYLYGLDATTPTKYVPATSTGGTATITVVPFNLTELDLTVQAVDRAGNLSPISAPFEIDTVAPNGNIATLAWWKLNIGNGTTAADATGNGADLQLNSSGSALGPCDATAGPAGYKCTLTLDGNGGRAFTDHPVLGNNGSFTVSTWVKASGCSGTCVAMSQAGTTVTGFNLGYQSNCTKGSTTGPCWVFSMPAADDPTATTHLLQTDPNSAHTGVWTQITGVYDSTHQQLLIYINGGDGTTPGNGKAAAQTAQVTVPSWSAPASGIMRFGSTWTAANGTGSYWNGEISATCAFFGPLGQTDIQTLYDGGAGDGCSALFTQYP